MRSACGNEDDGAGSNLLRVVAERDLGSPLEDHDHLVDRVRVEGNAIARGDLFDDQRDVVDVRAGTTVRIDEQHPSKGA